MDSKYRLTNEERAYEHLVEEYWETLSAAAKKILGRAESEASAMHLIPNYNYAIPDDYDEAVDFLDRASAELTGGDCKRLAEIWRAALAAGASVDPEDRSAHVTAYNLHQGVLHTYHRQVSRFVEDTLSHREAEESRRRYATQEPDDSWEDIPF